MTHKESGLPVASQTSQELTSFDKLARALEQAKSPAEKEKIAEQAHTISRHCELQGLFDKAFEYASLYCRGEFSLSKDTVGMDRHFKRKDKDKKSAIKKAYNKLSRQDFEAGIATLREKGRLPTREWFITKGKPLGSGDFEWYTPRWVYERARHIMGSIDLDPASSPQAVQMGNKAKHIFTLQDDALKQDWGKAGNVFINPPYTLKDSHKSGATAFLKKLMATDFKQAILLVLEDSGTGYGQALWQVIANCIFIPSGRLYFIYEGKVKKQSTTRSSIIFGVFVDELKFWLAFKNYGSVVTLYKTPKDLRSEYLKRKASLAPWERGLAKLPVSESRIRRKHRERAKAIKLLKPSIKEYIKRKKSNTVIGYEGTEAVYGPKTGHKDKVLSA